jgi:hypothetical protein
MAGQEKPLPKPPKKAFGIQKSVPEQGSQELLADRMAAAMAEGGLDEFLKQEMPDNEHAQALAKMMMGMTGMMPTGGMPAPMPPPQPSTGKDTSSATVPEDVFKAVQGGDVQGLMDLLRKEHQKRSPGEAGAEVAGTGPTQDASSPQASGMPTIDKDLIDAMIEMAKDNSVTMDWIILRAIKVYVEEYRKTGKL